MLDNSSGGDQADQEEEEAEREGELVVDILGICRHL